MDENKERQMNVDVVDTPEEEMENERQMEEQIPENKSKTDTINDELGPLFEEDAARKFRSRWLAIQSKFVDDPSDSVKQADDLVADVIKNVTMNLPTDGSLSKNNGMVETILPQKTCALL